MIGHTLPHRINIDVHIVFGTLALVLGIIAITSVKGGRLHRQAGRWFLYSMTIVLITAVIGLLIFDFRAFLSVVTLLSIYDAFSGFRALQLRGRRPQFFDRAFSFLGLISPIVFITLMRRLHQPWDPILTYSILGGLVAMSSYDLARNALPSGWLRRTWLQEHLVKMISAYIAISSAFAGTVFPRFMPWAAIIPTVVGYMTIIVFLIRGPARWDDAPTSRLYVAAPEERPLQSF